MQAIKVHIYDTLERGAEPLADIALNPSITALSWTHTLPGGPNTLNVGIEDSALRAGWGASYGYIPEPIGTKAFAHVEVSVGGTVVWEGRLVEDEIGPLGVQAFVADGYGLAATNADVYRSTSSSVTTTGDILEDILSEAAPLLSKGGSDEWSDPSVSHTRAEFDGMTLAEALDQISAEGGSGYVTWDWWVTIGRRLALLPRSAPSEPDYLIPYRPGEVTIRRDYREIATTAFVSYTSQGVEFSTAEETRNQTVYDYRINRRVRLQADELSATGAAQLRTMELERRSGPETSITVERGPGDDQWMTTPGGIGIPHWLVTAGQWVQVADQDPQIIVSASFDPNRGLSLELSAPSRQSFTTYLAATCAEVNKLAKSINPKTGGRRRGVRQQSSVTALSVSAGTYDGTVADVGAAFNQTTLNNNFRDLSDTINSLRTQLVNAKVLP